MEMPSVLKQKLEELSLGRKNDDLKKNAATLSLRYRTETKRGQDLIGGASGSVAYALSRMPATFGALSLVLKQASALRDFSPETMVDVGAGTGAAVWAASGFFGFRGITCLERSPDMRAVGERLTKEAEDFFAVSPVWRNFDLIRDSVPRADLITAGYVLNELDGSERINALSKLWTATRNVLVLVEPAAPENFRQMKEYRTFLINNGAFIAAPCPHQDECLNDWCHFGCRVARSKAHRIAKGGSAPFEDEKFCYLIATRQRYDTSAPRVLRRPVIETGKATLSLCTKGGITEKTFSRKDGPAYKAARKAEWADSFIPTERFFQPSDSCGI